MPTVLITGTSTGFGRVTTEVLAARGWRVFATMRDLKRKDPLERALRNAGLSDRVTFVQLDITDPASIEAAITTVLSKTGNASGARRAISGCRLLGGSRLFGSLAREQNVLCLVDATSKISGSASVRVQLHHQPSMRRANFALCRARLESEHLISLLGRRATCLASWRSRIAAWSVLGAAVTPSLQATVEISFEQGRALRVGGADFIE